MKRHIAACVILLALSAAAVAQSQMNPQSAPAQNGNSVPQTLYLPSGLDVQIRVNEMLSSATSQPGDTFTGSLVSSIDDDNGNIIFERGDQVTGRVVSARPSGRLQDSGQLVLSLSTIRSDRQIASLTVISKEITGASHTASNTAKVGGGAILGAIIGGLAGGGTGAAIGAGAGAAAGTGAAAATGRKEARVDPESLVRFVTSTETTVVPIGSAAARAMETQPSVYNDSGPRDQNAPVLRRRTPSDNPDSNANPPANNGNNYPNYPNNNYPNNHSRDNTTVAGNTTPDDAPVLRRREGSSSENDTASSAQPSASTPETTPDNSSANTVSNAPASTTAGWEFSPRDRRVISNCLADTPSSVPAKSANAIPYHKGDTLPYAAQKQAQALPLACERQLPAATANTERVIYNQQVLLVNTNSLVLDSIDINNH